MKSRTLSGRAAAICVSALCALASVSGAEQFHVPLHMPPHRLVPDGDSGREFLFGAGFAGISAPGLHASGTGGFIELGSLGGNKAGFSARGYGFPFSGDVDPLSIGHTGGGGLAGGFEIDLLLAPRGKEGYRLYAGFIANVTMLDIRNPLVVTFSGGNAKVEPDSALSMLIGFPAGVLIPLDISKSWRGELQADAAAFPAGVTFFSYTGLPATLYGSSRKIDPHYGCGARAGFTYIPWNLSIEALGRLSTGSGNNEPLSFGALQAAIKLF